MAIAIIPARMGSIRLPGKPLASIGGRPLIAHVVDRVRAAKRIDRIIVATDDDRILAAARDAGVDAVMTSSDHASGTDRVAEAAQGGDDAVIVNVQGDEPDLSPMTVDAVVDLMNNDESIDIGTAATPFRTEHDFLSPHRVKVVTNAAGHALYFSRSPIPFPRHERGEQAETDWLAALPARLHVGIYAYRRAALERLVRRPVSRLERSEGLEQLRALEAGLCIGVTMVEQTGSGIDTEADLEAYRTRFDQERTTPRH